MGQEVNITACSFPKQGSWLNRRVSVCFHYDTSQQVQGEIVREDAVSPGRMIIRLDDGHHILSTECMYSVLPTSSPAPATIESDARILAEYVSRNVDMDGVSPDVGEAVNRILDRTRAP